MRKRLLKFLSPLICVLTIYAPIELTRLILAYEHIEGVEIDIMWHFTAIAELTLIWVCYVVAMFLAYMLVKEVKIE